MFIATSWELRLLIKKFKFYWFPIIQLFLKLYRFDITLYINRINIFPRVITLKIYAYICNILFFYFKKDCIYLFLERGGGREREREGEKHQCVVASHVPPTGNLARNPGMCPDWESIQWPFGWQASAQSTEPHQPGQ